MSLKFEKKIENSTLSLSQILHFTSLVEILYRFTSVISNFRSLVTQAALDFSIYVFFHLIRVLSEQVRKKIENLTLSLSNPSEVGCSQTTKAEH